MKKLFKYKLNLTTVTLKWKQTLELKIINARRNAMRPYSVRMGMRAQMAEHTRDT